jgi:hypothetical protein
VQKTGAKVVASRSQDYSKYGNSDEAVKYAKDFSPATFGAKFLSIVNLF